MNTSRSRMFLYVAVMGMEGCWLFAILALVNALVLQGRLSIIGLLALYPVAFVINVMLTRPKLPRRYLNLITWSIWAGAMLLLVKLQLYGSLAALDPSWLKALFTALKQAPYHFQPEVLLFIGSMVIWWLSRRLAYLKPDFAKIIVELQFGMPLLIVAFIISSYFPGALEGAVFISVAFFAFALSGLSISHGQQADTSISQLYLGRWLGIIIGGISTVIVLGILSGSAVNPDLFAWLMGWIKWAWALVVKAVMWAASLLPTSATGDIPAVDSITGETGRRAAESGIFGIPQSVKSIIKFALYINIGFWCIFALWRVSGQILNWLNQRLASMAGVEVESLSGAFRSDVTRLMKRILARFLGFVLSYRRRKARALPPELASIQQIYLQMSRWAATKGCPRHPAQTACEYQTSLVNLLPELDEEFALITRQFVKVRYGDWTPGKDELHEMRESWQKIRQIRRKNPE
jgi:hypothetical protein